MELAAPTADELKALQQNGTQQKALKVGIHRKIPDLPAVADWVWTSVSGGQAGQFLITSEQATKLRALLRLHADLPTGVEIRIYTPDDTQTYGPFTQADFHTQQDANTKNTTLELWTPAISGSTLGIELFVPETIDPKNIQLEIPSLSHIAYDLSSGQFKNLGDTSSYRLSSCSISIACAAEQWQQTATAVARYIYTNQDGSSYVCSGTLISDQDINTQIPYFLTAAHCISDAAASSTMDFFWLYRESDCGIDDASWAQVSGGAELLSSQYELDATLVRLNQMPPAGVTMSGWALGSFATNEPVAGIHHAMGDIKQFSSGQFGQHVEITRVEGGYQARSDPDGNFTQVNWDNGITETGSSGSGLWKTIDAQHFLVGTLVGGTSTCATPQSPDEFSRMDRFYPYISEWLAAAPVAEPVKSILGDQSAPAAGLTDGIMLARYMQGIRGDALLDGITTDAVELSTIESRLSSAVDTLDIDQNGIAEAERDGLLLIRYLLGLRGNSLVADIDLEAVPHNTPDSITETINALLNGG